MPTQEEYNVTKQKYRELHTKINILNYNFQIVGTLIGSVIGSPSFSNDSTSDVRRTCSMQLYPKDSTFDIKQGSKIWIDKYVQVYIGIYNDDIKDITYTNMGIYIIDNPSQTYDAIQNIITISGLDLMARLTGMRNGNLEGLPYEVPQGSNVKNVLISLISLFGFKNYVIEDYPILTPYDINVDVSGFAYDIITEILNILPNYQSYFDVNGTFHFGKIPNGLNEQIRVTDDLWKSILVSYTRDYDYENIKNYIEVLGGTHDKTDSLGIVTVSNNVFSGANAEITSLEDNLMISFTTPSTIPSSALTNPYLLVNSFNSKPIYNPDLTTRPSLKINEYYVVKYDVTNGYYVFLGGLQPYAISKETNTDSPFYINGTSGILRIVLTGGDYDNINSDQLAKERANFELYQRCRLQDSVTITCVPVYWLDTNWLISITLPNKNTTEITELYLIKSITTDYGTSNTQTINLMKYYPYYPSI